MNLKQLRAALKAAQERAATALEAAQSANDGMGDSPSDEQLERWDQAEAELTSAKDAVTEAKRALDAAIAEARADLDEDGEPAPPADAAARRAAVQARRER
jgi:hypothetical protein